MHTDSCELKKISLAGMDELLKDYDRAATEFRPTASGSIRLMDK